MMVRLTATVEQASDSTFTAVAVIGEHSILGTGDTKEAAIEDLREGAEGLFEYLKSKGQPLPQLASVEVAA
jgi:predicted RNase H-like HicB family nuclease